MESVTATEIFIKKNIKLFNDTAYYIQRKQQNYLFLTRSEEIQS